MADSDYEEEEILVYVKFNGTLKEELVKQENPLIKVVGLDTDRPVMQIEGHYFSGEYQDMTGTALFFKEKELPPKDPIFGNDKISKSLEYVCKTNKVLNLNRVFLHERKKKDDKDESVSEKSKGDIPK